MLTPRRDAIEAVGFAKIGEAVPTLLAVLRGADRCAAALAAQALGRIGTKAAVDDLRKGRSKSVGCEGMACRPRSHTFKSMRLTLSRARWQHGRGVKGVKTRDARVGVSP